MLYTFLQKIMAFFIMGLVWLFLFSIPVGHHKQFYHVGYFYIVDTKPIHVTENAIDKSLNFIVKNMLNVATKLVDKMDSSHK